MGTATDECDIGGLFFSGFGLLELGRGRCRRCGRHWGIACFETAGDDASAIANIEECIWVGDGGGYDAVVRKGDEGEMLVVETGVFCWARGQEVVSKRFQRLWSNGGDFLTGK